MVEGRAKNILKHGSMPNLRQMLPLLVVPVFIGAFLAVRELGGRHPVQPLGCRVRLGYGFWMAIGHRNPYGRSPLFRQWSMHFAWSAGFWMELLSFRGRKVSS